ncbi:MAG: hypothetical protein KAK00_03455 [Nanoarchaeota archaeon]|nr:hypothetical protein [Nanoarchaeota archaeon]
MVPLKPEIPININKLFEFVFPKKEKYINEKIIFYLRLYTDLVRAEDNISKSRYKKMINLLKVVRNTTKGTTFKEDELYLKRIRQISNEILSNVKCVKCRSKDCQICDSAHMKTKLQLAQNICILRILKR